MPEEAPAEQVPDDVPEAEEGAVREAARRHTKDAHRERGGDRNDRHRASGETDPDGSS